jgi:eukaryotic-like serine/threonine-protein kinase
MNEETCPHCRKIIPGDAPMGLCPPCAFGVALDVGSILTDHPDVPPSAPAGGDPPSVLPGGVHLFGKYELIQRIGRGGAGVVYKARDTWTKGVVALKMIIGGELASDAEVYRFRFDAEAAASLDHPNIVPIFEGGEHEGQLYFTMKLMQGGSLAKDENLAQYRGDPGRAAELVETIAMAVHHAHQHGILHRDLKPANILLDDAGKPHIADFGVAKHVDKHGGLTGTNAVVSTTSYMAPEQANGQTVTMAADVYSLGVILFELTTGQQPFIGNTSAEILEKVKHTPPPDPRTFEPRIDRDLATLCLRCLEKDPEHRYGSAEELARELRRYLNGEPIAKVSRVAQAWRGFLRHPKTAGIILALVTILVTMTPSVISLVRAQQAAKREQIRQRNMNSAVMVAGTVLSQLRALSDAVERAAADPSLAQALQSADVAAQGSFCKSMYDRYEDPFYGLKLNDNSPFDMWFILDEQGMLLVQYSKPPLEFFRLSPDPLEYAWRDYFKGAWKLAEKRLSSSYVSRAIQSEHDGNYKFAISAPIYGSDRRPIGVLVAAVATAANLGSLVVRDPHSIAVLVAPRDRDRDPPQPASTHLIPLHPYYVYGDATPIENEQVRRLDEASRDPLLRIERPLGLPPPNLVTSSDDYEDPVAKKYRNDAGRWIAGFAPVGNTGYVVIVQTREEEALASEMQLGAQLAKRALISGSLGVLPLFLAVWYEKRRKARRAPR